MTSNPPTTIAALLAALEVPREGSIYVQSSLDWIQRAGFGAADVLPALRRWAGASGTLVMPSYPFHTSHLEYLESGASFDVRRTPSAIGLLPEMFRRTKGVVRSLDPDFCVAAIGPDAEAVVGRAPAEPDPFGPDSSYQRMIDGNATLLGLGVSLNTSSFIHAIDSRAQAGYPSAVYDDRRFTVNVTDAAGRTIAVQRQALRPAFQRLTSPSAVGDAMAPAADVFMAIDINGARFFKWRLGPWAAWCLAHAGAQRATGAWPCWLSRLSGHVQ